MRKKKPVSEAAEQIAFYAKLRARRQKERREAKATKRKPLTKSQPPENR